MKNKTIPMIYRIFMALTFLCGCVMMFWFVRFSVFALNDASFEDEGVAATIGNFAYFFFGFLVMTAVAFVLSIICFKAAKPAASVCRTVFTAAAGIVCLPSIKIMHVLIDIKKFYVDNELNLDYVTSVDAESEIPMMFLPIISFIIMLVLFITSMVALAKGPIIEEDKIEM